MDGSDVPAVPRRIAGLAEVFVHAVDDWRRKPHVVAPVLFLICSIVFVSTQLSYYGWGGLLDTRLPQIVQQSAPLLILCIGSGLVIATGQIDLSPTAIGAVSGVIFVALIKNVGLGWPVAGFIVLAVGLAAGYLNGFLVARVGAPSLIVTWATGLALTIAAIMLSVAIGGKEATQGLPFESFDPLFALGEQGFWLFISCAALAIVFITSTNFAREAMAVGADLQSATFIGIQPRSVVLVSFALSGLFGAVAGILNCYSVGSARSIDLQTDSLVVVAICVLGGTLLSGGYYSAVSIAFAVLVWRELELMVPRIRLPVSSEAEPYLIQVAFGLVVLFAAILFARQLRGHLRSVLMRPKVDA